MRQVIDSFDGVSLRSGESAYQAVRDAKNVDIEYDLILKKKRLRKAKGFTVVEPTPISATYSSGSASTVVFAVTAGHGVIAGQCLIVSVDSSLYPEATSLLVGKLFKVNSVGATSITLDVTGGNTVTGYSCSLHKQFQTLGAYIFDPAKMALSSGDSIELISCYGSNDKDFDGNFYSCIGVNDYQLLCVTSKTSGGWTVVDNTVYFNTTTKAEFVKYGSYVVFCKGETKEIDSAYGGVLYITGAGAIDLFGEDNNPTGRTIKVSQERLFVGHITAQSNTAISNGKSWVAVSKIFPEPSDTYKSISTITHGVTTLLTFVSNHSFKINDYIFVDGSTAYDLNGKYVKITAIPAANTVVVDFETTADGTGGIARINGYTWSPSSNLFDDGLAGGGIFKCDDNEDDSVMGLETTMGGILIARKYSMYIFIGSLATGDFTLTKQLNTDYGVMSQSLCQSSKGVWFISQYGLSKLEGVTIKTQETNFDNLTTITASYAIQPKIDSITDKSRLIIVTTDNKVWLHDNYTKTTYVYDTVSDSWVFHYGKQAEAFIKSGEQVYGISNGIVYLYNNGYQSHSPLTMSYSNIPSYYPTWTMDQGVPDLTKFYEFLYFIYDGSYTQNTSIIYVDIYLDADNDNAILTIELDATINVARTWSQLFPVPTWIGNKTPLVTTDTWLSLATGNVSLFKKGHYYNIGKGKQIMFAFRHSDNSDFTMTRFELEYTQLGSRDVEDSK